MKNVLFYGSGAVGLSLAGWLSHPDIQITVLARQGSAAILKEHGIEVLCSDLLVRARPLVVTSLEQAIQPDLIVICVKAFALKDVVDEIRMHFGREMPVMSVLNGVRHVDLLRSKFSNVLFATICFNAFRQSAFQAEALSRGPIVLTSSRSTEKHLKREIFDWMKGRVELIQHGDPMDVACNKMIINLGNALLTMVAFHDNRDRELKSLQHIMANVLWEGVLVMRAHGVKEVSIPGMPSWRMLKLSRILPQFITVPIFRKKMASSAINSMAQDIARGSETEIEELTGYFLSMAKKVDLKVPYNKAVYALFKEWSADSNPSLAPSEILARKKSTASR